MITFYTNHQKDSNYLYSFLLSSVLVTHGNSSINFVESSVMSSRHVNILKIFEKMYIRNPYYHYISVFSQYQLCQSMQRFIYPIEPRARKLISWAQDWMKFLQYETDCAHRIPKIYSMLPLLIHSSHVLQKKCTLILPSSSDGPTPGHVEFVK